MNIQLRQNINLASYTIFKIGGTARFFYEPTSIHDCLEALQWAKQYALPIFILGAGSNILISNKEFNGLVLRPLFGSISCVGNILTVEAGTMMPRVATEAIQKGLSGFEWALGIPGTVGGSVRGNAGCFGKSIGDVLENVLVFDMKLGKQKKFSNADCRFLYRESMFKHHPEYLILAATFALSPEEKNIIQEKMKEYSKKRAVTQAIGKKCAGCVFKNTPWNAISYKKRLKIFQALPGAEKFLNEPRLPTSFVLDRLGLRGLKIGNASISEKHANFFINEKNASFEEVLMLISHCKEYVHRKIGLLLEEEIQYIV